MATKLVVFEGIDNSGKTTVSKLVMEKLKKATAISWKWNKEPRFSTERADFLNSEAMKDPCLRESFFFFSRYEGQKDYQKSNTVLDRYLWTGVAYAKVFSPATYEMMKHIYLPSTDITTTPVFKMPDLHVFMDTDPEICLSREPEVGIERLRNIRQAYMDTRSLISGPVIFSAANGDKTPEQLADELVPLIMDALV